MTISAGVRCCPCSGLGFFISKQMNYHKVAAFPENFFGALPLPLIRSLNQNHTGWRRRCEFFGK